MDELYPPENTPVLVDTYIGVALMKWMSINDKKQWLGLFGDYIYVDPRYQPIWWHEVPPRETPSDARSSIHTPQGNDREV